MLTEITLKEAQTAMLDLLKIIDRICRENNLQYWLDHGTLLGAVRHQGYIPWDDDVDICIMKEDYEQLLDLLEKESQTNSDIFLLFSSNNASDQYWCEYLCSTKYVFGYGKKEIIPLRVDIFPMKSMDMAQETEDRLITDTAKYFIQGKANAPEQLDKKYLKKTLPEALKAKQQFLRYYNNEYMVSCDKEEPSSLVTFSYGDNISKNKEYFTYSDIFPLKEIEFEGYTFFSPYNTDKYLHILYGDYMQLPPKSKQKTSYTDFFSCTSKAFALEKSKEYMEKKNTLFFNKKKLSYKIKHFFWLIKYEGFFTTLKIIYSLKFKKSSTIS